MDAIENKHSFRNQGCVDFLAKTRILQDAKKTRSTELGQFLAKTAAGYSCFLTLKPTRPVKIVQKLTLGACMVGICIMENYIVKLV